MNFAKNSYLVNLTIKKPLETSYFNVSKYQYPFYIQNKIYREQNF